MTIFDELRVDYTRWRQRHLDYRDAAMQFAQTFANGFKDYIGAPDNYLDFNRKPIWYVQPQKVSPRDDDGGYEFEQSDSPRSMIYLDDDGRWLAGLKVTLDSDANTFPKSSFTMAYTFSLRNSTCEMSVGRPHQRQFSFPTTDLKKRKPVYDHLVSLIKRVLNLKPWDIPKKETIGFTPPRE